MKPNTYIQHFHSIPEFTEKVDKMHSVPRDINSYSFCGNMSMNRAVEASVYGDPETTRVCQEYVSKIDVDHFVNNSQMMLEPHVCGPIANVPRYLMDLPDSMMRIEKRDTLGPMRIVYNCAVSGGVSTTQMQQFGAMVFSLFQAMQQIRPVELIITATLGHYDARGKKAYVPIIHLDAGTPLHQIAFAMSHAAFLRRLVFHWTRDAQGGYDGMIAWGWGLMPDNTNERMAECLETQGNDWYRIDGKEHTIDDNTLYITGRHLRHENLSNPEQWLKERIEQFSQGH